MDVPVDSQGFIVSFEIEQAQDIRTFFNTFGFVCIKDVLDDSEIQASCTEFFSMFDRDDEASIENFFGSQPFAKFGVIGAEPTLQYSLSYKKRQNEIGVAFIKKRRLFT